jgi:hypothetical protein
LDRIDSGVLFEELSFHSPTMRSCIRLLLLVVVAALATGCGNGKNSLPHASGLTGDMYVVMDSLQWQGELGKVVDSLFSADMEGLPRGEPIFNMKWVDPRKLNFILKQRRNLIFVMTLDQESEGAAVVRRLFTPASLEKIRTDEGIYLQTDKDLFATGQEVMFLFGKTNNELIANVRKNGARLVDYFNVKERERLGQNLLKVGQQKGIKDWLVKNFNCEITIPYGYKLVQAENNFLWARQINPADDKDIFIARKNYSDVGQFSKDSLIRFRDDVCRKYLFEDPDLPNSYLVTEMLPYVPVQTREINFNGRYAVEMRGLWRTNNKSMGGPFVSYAIADETLGKFYYIEGFTFSPSKSQREIMRELETILLTFRINGK